MKCCIPLPDRLTLGSSEEKELKDDSSNDNNQLRDMQRQIEMMETRLALLLGRPQA